MLYERKFSFATIGPRTVKRTDRSTSVDNKAVFASSMFGFGWGLLGDPPSPNSARPIAITAATATIVMIITSRIGMKLEIEFRG